MQNIWTIVKKELARVFTDKRMILSLFILPAFMIMVIYGVMGIAGENETNKVEEHQSIIYIMDAPNAIESNLGEDVPDFTSFISNTMDNIAITSVKTDEVNFEDLKEDVKNKEIDVLIKFPVDFKTTIKEYETNGGMIPTIEVYHNINSNYSMNANYEVTAILASYKIKLQSTRIDLDELKVFQQLDTGLGDVEKAKGQGLAMFIPMILIIYLMAGAMGIGMESIAGEKERGTIATLLVTPIKRGQLAIGKIVSISIIATLSALSSFLGLIAVLPIFTKVMGESEGISGANYQVFHYLMMLTLMVSAVLIFVGLIVIVSAYAKSVKEAGALILPLYALVIGMAMYSMFTMEVPQKFHLYLIPIYNVVLALKAVFTFDLEITNWILTLSSTIVYTLILIFIIQKMFKSEKIMFNK